MHSLRGPSAVMSPESMSLLGEGISLVLSRWTALQTAIQNEWGGTESRRKSAELVSTLLSWFSSQSKVSLQIEDLESILEENMALSFNAAIEDGSVEEVAEHLMIMHEEFLQGNYESIEKLRKPIPTRNTMSQSRMMRTGNW